MDNAESNATPNPLTRGQVEAVRFQVTKPGYAFPQVEAFIEKVKSTLEFLEKEMKKDKIALAEAQDEIELLTDRAQTLSATLEIFKVKGDAIVNAEGDYLTESQLSKISKLEEENAYLRNQLRVAQEDANAGWEAEAELRKYIEEQLLPWLNTHKEDIVSNVDKEKATVESLIDEPLIEDEVEPLIDEPLIEDDVSSIVFEEELEHAEHIPVQVENVPLISSESEEDWFK